jgi:hypothetical protein
MPADRDGAACAGAGVRKPPRNEPAGEVGGRRSALSYGDLGVAEGACDGRNALEDGQWRAWCGTQKQVLMVEVAVKRGHRRLTLTLVRRI